jgi:hypothetical protein
MSPMMPAISTAWMGKEKVRTGNRDSLDNLDSIDGSKTSRESAEYRGSDVRCVDCRHFDGVDSCSVVEGEIQPDGNSRFFERRETGEETVRDNSEEGETVDV